MQVRLASPDDRDERAMLGLLKRMGEEPGPFRIAWPRLMDHARKVLEEGAVLLAEIDREAVGSIGLMAEQPWQSEDFVLRDYWAYVVPEARKTRAMAMLVEEAMRVSGRLPMPLLISRVASEDIKGETKFFSRYLTPTGVIFMSGRS